VGTSMRHSGLNFCDADKPLRADSPFACVCMVHFDNKDSVINFCNFFVDEHPESDKISQDEKNYTTITPNMLVSEYEQLVSYADSSSSAYRLKLFFPHVKDQSFSREEVSVALQNLLDNHVENEAELVISEVDYCTSGIVSGSEPDYSLVWSICFNELQDAEQFADKISTTENTQYLKELLYAEPRIMLSKIMVFDIALTEPYR
jgi:hypothetical protein